MKQIILYYLLFISSHLFGQKTVEDFGYKHFQINYLGENVDFIVKSKKGGELTKKPLLIFIQGSLAQPLIKYKDDGTYYPPFPFSENTFLNEFHLIVIGKPGIPIIENVKNLSEEREFVDSLSELPPTKYTTNNNLEYYYKRNNKVIKYLLKQEWVDKSKIIVAGHSEGSSIAAKIASTNKNITHLIYSGSTIYYPRILSMVNQDRYSETDEDSWVNKDFEYWKNVNENPTDLSRKHGFNSYKGTFSFSKSLDKDLIKLKIPVLISFGTKDPACTLNDLFRIETISKNIQNIKFKAYIGLEHNYFPLKNGQIDYSQFGWDNVGLDWKNWINENKKPVHNK